MLTIQERFIFLCSFDFLRLIDIRAYEFYLFVTRFIEKDVFNLRSRRRVRDDDKINYHGVEDVNKLSTRIRANYQQRGEYYEREPQEDCQKIDHRRNCWEKSKRLPSLEKKREEEEKCSTNRTAESGDECSFLELSSFAGEQSERDTYIPK